MFVYLNFFSNSFSSLSVISFNYYVTFWLFLGDIFNHLFCTYLHLPLLRSTSSITLLFALMKVLKFWRGFSFICHRVLVKTISDNLTPLICCVWYTNEAQDLNFFSLFHTNNIRLFISIILFLFSRFLSKLYE